MHQLVLTCILLFGPCGLALSHCQFDQNRVATYGASFRVGFWVLLRERNRRICDRIRGPVAVEAKET